MNQLREHFGARGMLVSHHQSSCFFQNGRQFCYVWKWLGKIRAAREYDGASIYAHTPEWEERFLETSMSFSTMEAFG